MRRAALFVACALATTIPARAQTLGRYRFEQPAMGTVVALVLYAKDSLSAQRAAAAAFERIDELEARLSDFDPESEISLLSSTAGTGRWVGVSPDLWNVLSRGRAWSARSNGAFDLTVGALTRLWRWSHRRDLPVDTTRWATALGTVGFDGLSLEPLGRRVRLERPRMRLDVGGIGKGYAADQALIVLEAHGIKSALVDVGGDLVLGAAPPNESGWRIEVPAVGKQGRLRSMTNTLAGVAIATSGDEFRFIEIGDVRRSHLIDPRTGQPVSLRRIVTVVAPTGADADALASALSILGPRDGFPVIDASDSICVQILEEDHLPEDRWQSWSQCTSDQRIFTTRLPS